MKLIQNVTIVLENDYFANYVRAFMFRFNMSNGMAAILAYGGRTQVDHFYFSDKKVNF